MSTKREPLLSESEIDLIDRAAERTSMRTSMEVARYYEAARAKDAELIQQLVDGIEYVYWTKPQFARARVVELLRIAAAAGFKPSEP